MRKAQSLHTSAMQAVDRALAARRADQAAASMELFREALRLESAAATATRDQPSRGILFRSAAHIALECQDHDAAEQLACQGLLGRPPEGVAEELRHVLDQATFRRHLHLDGIELGPTAIQLVLAGPRVGYGDVPEPEIMSRVDAYRKLASRSVHRRRGQPYSDSMPTITDEDFQLYMSTPRAASFAVTLRIGARQSQGYLDFGIGPETIVNDVLSNLERFEANDEEGLRQSIPQPDYRRNFIALARRLSPDGTAITTVGITRQVKGIETQLALRKPRATHSLERSTRVTRQVEILEGRLEFADSRKHSTDSGKIILTTNAGELKIAVPSGILADIVRPHYEQLVRIKAERRSMHLYKFIDFV
jgi:hypothetical protein